MPFYIVSHATNIIISQLHENKGFLKSTLVKGRTERGLNIYMN